MDNRSRRFPHLAKSSMELCHRITQGRKQPARIIGRRTQAPHQGLERLAFNVFHHHVKFVARTAAIDNPGQVLKTPSGTLGRKQALICPANLGRSIDAFADKGAERPSTRTLKAHEFGCLNVRAL